MINDKIHYYNMHHKDDRHSWLFCQDYIHTVGYMVKHSGSAAWNNPNKVPGYLKAPCSVQTFRVKFKLVRTAQFA